MSEYVVNFGDKSTAFVGLAMAEAESHGATIMERVVRCKDCKFRSKACCWCIGGGANPSGFCAWGERRDACD